MSGRAKSFLNINGQSQAAQAGRRSCRRQQQGQAMQVGSRGMKRSEHGNSAGGQAINENTNWVGKRQKTKKNIKRVINKIFHKKGRKKNEIHKQV